MRVKDFEEKIDMLGGVRIIEMRMRHSTVTKVFGRAEKSLIMWDDMGRAFYKPLPEDFDEEKLDKHVKGGWKRTVRWDLDFFP